MRNHMNDPIHIALAADHRYLPGLLVTAVSIMRSAITNLCGHDILYKSESGYIVYERLFGEWLRRHAAADCAAS